MLNFFVGIAVAFILITVFALGIWVGKTIEEVGGFD